MGGEESSKQVVGLLAGLFVAFFPFNCLMRWSTPTLRSIVCRLLLDNLFKALLFLNRCSAKIQDQVHTHARRPV